MPDLAKHRAEAAAELEVAFESFCFAGKTFPSGDFENPLEARDIIGPYAVIAVVAQETRGVVFYGSGNDDGYRGDCRLECRHGQAVPNPRRWPA
jgi:hypothetical protein